MTEYSALPFGQFPKTRYSIRRYGQTVYSFVTTIRSEEESVEILKERADGLDNYIITKKQGLVETILYDSCPVKRVPTSSPKVSTISFELGEYIKEHHMERTDEEIGSIFRVYPCEVKRWRLRHKFFRPNERK